MREGAPGGQPGVEVKSDRDDEDDDDQEDQDDQDVEEDVHVKEEEEKERIGEEVKTETKSETRDSIERKTEEPGGEGTEQSDAVKSEVRVNTHLWKICPLEDPLNLNNWPRTTSVQLCATWSK